jgi:hypothetical protein
MKIIAEASRRETHTEHVVVDAAIDVRMAKIDESGALRFSVPTMAITLTPGAEYNFSISINPQEMDALHRASLTLPTAPKISAITSRRL